MGGAPDGALRVLAYGSSVLPRRLQAPSRVQLGNWRHFAHVDIVAVVHRLPVAVGPARDVGRCGGYQHDGVHTGLRTRSEIRVARWR